MKKGMEDPRIVKIGDTFYLTYVAHDGKNALIAYASGKNLFKLKEAASSAQKFLTAEPAGFSNIPN